MAPSSFDTAFPKSPHADIGAPLHLRLSSCRIARQLCKEEDMELFAGGVVGLSAGGVVGPSAGGVVGIAQITTGPFVTVTHPEYVA